MFDLAGMLQGCNVPVFFVSEGQSGKSVSRKNQVRGSRGSGGFKRIKIIIHPFRSDGA